MSTWGIWGYWGIVTGLVVLVTVFFVCIAILSSAPTKGRGPVTGKTETDDGDREKGAAGTKHAA